MQVQWFGPYGLVTAPYSKELIADLSHNGIVFSVTGELDDNE